MLAKIKKLLALDLKTENKPTRVDSLEIDENNPYGLIIQKACGAFKVSSVGRGIVADNNGFLEDAPVHCGYIFRIEGGKIVRYIKRFQI